MLLAVDVGNTEITVGLFRDTRVAARWRLTTVERRTPDEWGALLTSYLGQAGISTQEVRAAVEASVAPATTVPLAEGVERAFGIRPVSIGPESNLAVTLDVDEPHSVGADRVVNALAAIELYARDTIVVDFGTATSFDCVTADRRFIGGVIAPGVVTASDNLVRRAAKLAATELIPPERVIGRRTDDCIRSGVLFGAADTVDGMIRRIRAEWPGDAAPFAVATGGLAPVVVALCKEIQHQEPDLTLIGLRHAAHQVGLAW
ncbi:MAG TPA: type III pantothenate kinase [Gemmatimonadales bacterium]